MSETETGKVTCEKCGRGGFTYDGVCRACATGEKTGTPNWRIVAGACPKCGNRLIENNRGVECSELRCDWSANSGVTLTETTSTHEERAKQITDDFSFWGPAQGDYHSERARCTLLIADALRAVERETLERAANEIKDEFADWDDATYSAATRIADRLTKGGDTETCKHSWKTCHGVTYCTDCDAKKKGSPT